MFPHTDVLLGETFTLLATVEQMTLNYAVHDL